MSSTSGDHELPHELLHPLALVVLLFGFTVKSNMLHYTVCTLHSFDLENLCVQSIFHVSHLRGLFPSQLFKTVDMPNLGGGTQMF